MTGSADTIAKSMDLRNPYVGPRPFESGETLYGRDREIRDLDNLLSAERIVLLYSPSGAGKSSLVQAGLLPRLRRTFSIWGPTRVNQPAHADTANRYVMSAILGFEEDIPQRLRREDSVLAGQTLREYVEKRPHRRSAPPNILLVFDQFEEILTIDPLAITAKQGFFDQLGELLRNPRVWALFALREDYLAPLDPYAQRVPSHLKNRYRIDLLGLQAARESIVEPARSHGRAFPAADQLVQDLATVQIQQMDGSFRAQTGNYVEPVQLQVVCRRLWDAMPEDDPSIDSEDLAAFGDVGEALGAYYASEVAKIADTDSALERGIREWFHDKLISTDGIRNQVLHGFETSEGLDNRIIGRLLDTHLIRAEKRAGATRFELAHDRLLAPVRNDNEHWFGEHLNQFQRQAGFWDKQGRPDNLLLNEHELLQARTWAAQTKIALREEEQELLERSQKQLEAQHQLKSEQERSNRLLWSAFVITSILMVAVAVFAAWTYLARQKAIDALAIAGQQTQLANEATEQAEQQTQRANYNLAKVYEERAGSALRSAQERNRREDYQQTWLYTLAALKQTDDPAQALPLSLGRLLLPELIPSAGWRDGVIDTDAALLDVTISRDGQWLAAGLRIAEQVSQGKTNRAPDTRAPTLLLWEYSSGRFVCRAQAQNATDDDSRCALPAHTGSVVSVAFSHDGRWLASASTDNTIRLWDLSAEPVSSRVLSSNSREIHDVAFSTDDRLLAAAAGDSHVQLWDLDTGNTAAPRLLTGHSAAVHSVAFSDDGRWLASAGTDATLQLWHSADEYTSATRLPFTQNVNELVFSSAGDWLAAAGNGGDIGLWRITADAPAPDSARYLSGHEGAVHTLAFSADGSLLASGGDDQTVRLWDSATASEAATIRAHKGAVLSVAFTSAGDRLLSASADQTIRRINLSIDPFDSGTPWDLRTFIGERLAGQPSPRLQQTYEQAFAKLPYRLDDWDLIETSRSEALRIARLYYGAQISQTRVANLIFHAGQTVDFHNDNAAGYPLWRSDDIVLLPDNLYDAAVALFLKNDVTLPFVIEFEYSLFDDDGGAGEIWNSADGLTFIFLKNKAAYEVAGATPPTGDRQGFLRDGTGYGVFFSLYGERRIDLKDGDGNILTSSNYFPGAATPRVYTHGEWQPVRIEVSRNSVSVSSAGSLVFSWNGQLNDTFAGIGFSAATGGADAEHKLRNIRLNIR